MAGISLDQKGSMRKTDPRKKIVLIIVIVLAVLVGLAVFLEEKDKPVPVSPPSSPAGDVLPPVVKLEHALPVFLIKGCLFDLGIPRKNVRFMGNTVKISLQTPLSSDKISKAFDPIKEIGEVHVEDERNVRIVIDKKTWVIIFSVVSGRIARCAIIIDDMSLMGPAEELGKIDAQLTFAVLPGNAESKAVARYLHSKGKEILLHLPMQGNGKNPGPGAIFQDMSPSEIGSILKKDLSAVPYISGVNNHMGSLVTTNEGIMRMVMREVKEKGLFYVDSLTTGKSVCGPIARELEVPVIARDVFLDNELNPAYINSQIDQLVKISLKHENAVAICHPHPETIAVLKKEIPKLKKRGVEVVRVSALVDK